MGSVNWRHAPDIELQARLDQPRHGLLFDIQNHSFWPRSWGTRPPANQAEQIARQQISRLPRLIPVLIGLAARDLPLGSW